MDRLKEYEKIYEKNKSTVYRYLKKRGLSDAVIYKLMQMLWVSMVKEKSLLHVDEACQRKWLLLRALELEHILTDK